MASDLKAFGNNAGQVILRELDDSPQYEVVLIWNHQILTTEKEAEHSLIKTDDMIEAITEFNLAMQRL